MNSDTVIVVVRYVLTIVGTFLTARGLVSADAFKTIIDQIITVVGGILTLAPLVWAIYVRYNTKAVPIATANRDDVPTVSATTGAVIPTTRKK